MRAVFALVIALLLCGGALSSDAGELQMECGNTLISASPAKVKGGESYLRYFRVLLRNDLGEKAIEFSPENDLLHLSCIYRDSSTFLLVNHYCGGSGCAESNYGVIQLPSLRVLLKPDDRWKGNASVASALLGAIPPKPDCAVKSTTSLCLQSEQE